MSEIEKQNKSYEIEIGEELLRDTIDREVNHLETIEQTMPDYEDITYNEIYQELFEIYDKHEEHELQWER